MIALGWMVLMAGLQAAASPSPEGVSAARPAQPSSAPSPATPVDEVVVFAPKIPKEPDWSKKLDLDPRRDFQESYDPYLRQRPTNGCKPMAGGGVDPMGKVGAVGGLVCAKRF